MHPGDNGLEQDLGIDISPVTEGRAAISGVLFSATPKFNPDVEMMITDLYHRYIDHVARYVAKGLLDKCGEDLVCQGGDGSNYLAPTWGEIVKHIRSNASLVEKVRQGFADILPIPFACTLGSKAERLRKIMQSNNRYRDKPHELLAPNLGVFDDNNDDLVYFPKRLNATGHEGTTKKVLLNNPNNAWRIVLVNNQDQAGAGVYIGESAQNVLDNIQNDSARKGEIIMDADTYLTFAAALWSRDIPVDDLNANHTKGKLTLCANTLNIEEAKIPGMGWNHIQRKPAIVPHSIATKNDFRVVRTYVPIYPRHY